MNYRLKQKQTIKKINSYDAQTKLASKQIEELQQQKLLLETKFTNSEKHIIMLKGNIDILQETIRAKDDIMQKYTTEYSELYKVKEKESVQITLLANENEAMRSRILALEQYEEQLKRSKTEEMIKAGIKEKQFTDSNIELQKQYAIISYNLEATKLELEKAKHDNVEYNKLIEKYADTLARATQL